MAISKELPSGLTPALINRKDFMWDDKLDEPHVRRAAAILKAHPEVKNLFGYDPITKYVVFLMVTVQLMLMAFVANQSWPVFLAVMYVFGAPLNHAAAMAIHEITHGVAAEKLSHNYLLAIFVNLQLGIPSAMAFKKYHLEHHIYLGVDGYDTDLPTKTESKIFSSDSKLKKLCWAFMLAGFYSLRPFIVRRRPFSLWELFNIVVILAADVVIYKIFGGYAILYLILSSYFGMGFHPCAGHLLHEHYITVEGQETYSYYGWANEFCFNVGYHNEHHDFPQIPYTRLPQLRKIAPEFYNNLATYDSMWRALWDLIMIDGYGLTNRIKRDIKVHNKARTDFALQQYKELKEAAK